MDSSRPNATPLKFLLDEINFQRTKELMRQTLREDGGFVVLPGANTFWTDLFVRHFLFEADASVQESDDLLFFVRYKHVKGSSRINPKYETDINVFRRDSRKLPIGDPEINWEETVYLNLVIHQFDYKVTLAICTRTSPKELQVLRRHSQRVYASPSRRTMDKKGESEDITYPNICFMVDNFDDIFKDILVRDGEMVCVELVANDKEGTAQGVIFLGSIRYEALKKVYDARQSSLSAKVAQRMSFGLLGGAQNARCEFVRMKGPCGKGHAEMAVTKPKGNSGIETPTSEPGFCMTDFEDWGGGGEDDQDFFNYRHRRRLSDPSANLNNFNRHAFRSMANNSETAAGKARSENEGLDNLANELYEVEAGDLRDDRPVPLRDGRRREETGDGEVVVGVDGPGVDRGDFQAAAAAAAQRRKRASSVTCCNCFRRPRLKSCLSHDGEFSSSCSGMSDMSQVLADRMARIEIGPGDPPMGESAGQRRSRNGRKRGQEMIPMRSLSRGGRDENAEVFQEYELADDAIDELSDGNVNEPLLDAAEAEAKAVGKGPKDEDLVGDENGNGNTSEDDFERIGCDFNDCDRKVVGREELPVCSSVGPRGVPVSKSVDTESVNLCRKHKFATFPRMKRRRRMFTNRIALKGRGECPKRQRGENRSSGPPQKTTKDGTKIFYWCDANANAKSTHAKELDDGAYNPIWTSRGFTQSFHFWKENKRQSSTPLNALLTYISLPWWNIAKDILDKKDPPILTF